MKAKCSLYLGLVIAGASIIWLQSILGLIIEGIGLFGMLLETIKE